MTRQHHPNLLSNDPFGAVLEAMQQRSDFVARPETLKEYSLWLASYHSSNFKDHPIEVPGSPMAEL
jgi:hypothetical protein